MPASSCDGERAPSKDAPGNLEVQLAKSLVSLQGCLSKAVVSKHTVAGLNRKVQTQTVAKDLPHVNLVFIGPCSSGKLLDQTRVLDVFRRSCGQLERYRDIESQVTG